MIAPMTDTPARFLTPDLFRRIAVTLLALGLYRVGQWIPLPGLNLAALAQAGTLDTFSVSRPSTSIMALGLLPLLTALVLAEGLLCLSPRLRRWGETPSGRTSLWRGAIIAALTLAALQAWGVARALEAIPGVVIAPGAAFQVGATVSFVGATLIIVWLSDGITRHGLGHGFWVLLAASYAETFVQPLVLQLPLLAMGAIRVGNYLLSIATWFGFLALTTAALTALVKARPPLSTPQELLWVPLVAPMAVTLAVSAVLMTVWLVLPGDSALAVAEGIAMELTLPMLTIAVAAVVLLRRKSMLLPGERVNVHAAVPVIAALVAAVVASVFFPHAKIALLLAAIGLVILETIRPATTHTETPPLAPERFPAT